MFSDNIREHRRYIIIRFFVTKLREAFASSPLFRVLHVACDADDDEEIFRAFPGVASKQTSTVLLDRKRLALAFFRGEYPSPNPR